MKMNFLEKKSLKVIKNKKNAEATKIVFVRKLILNFFKIKKDYKSEISKNKIKNNLIFNSDLIQFNFGPIAIAIKKGTKKGIINLL